MQLGGYRLHVRAKGVVKEKRVEITDDVKAILEAGRVERKCYYLPERQLDRAEYVKVNKILKLLGGKWNHNKRAHVFADETAAISVLDSLDSGSVVDTKATYQFFETPKKIARQMVELANIHDGMIVLEPSAGDGAIAEALAEYDIEKPLYNIGLIMVEIDPEKCKALAGKKLGNVLCQDFLGNFADEYGRFDRIIMNPPFTRGQEAEHVLHAYERCLYPGGRLVSVMSASVKFNQQKKYALVRELIENHGEIIELPEGAFRESGTSVNTVLAILNKPLS